MRSIQVSLDVYQAIWSARKPGQDTEDAILRGVFNIPAADPNVPGRDIMVTVGFHDREPEK